jgi:serine/threonine-protein kinase
MFPKQSWAQLSALLDRALELEPAARAAWLDELARDEPDVAGTLRELLAEKDAADARHFLEAPPSSWPGALVPAAGQRFGAWELERPLGQGGMGAVWLARRCDGRYEGEAAIKFLNLALVGGPAEQRFGREGTLLASLRHPHIAHLVDAGVTVCGQPYLVLEHVEGMPIDEHCEQHRLGLRQRVRLFLDVLDAVGYAHRHLVVHRDLKPANILVTADGRVKLLDFGIATLVTPAVEPGGCDATREIGSALTPEYAAPEQFLGEPVTTATDIYALGRILHLLLAGRPVSRETPLTAAEAARLALTAEPPLVSECCNDRATRRLLRGDLDNIVRKALRPDPSDRYATAESFAADLRRYLDDEPVSARAQSPAYRVGKFVRRHRGGVFSGVVSALALVAVTIFAVLQMLEAERQRDGAEAQRRLAEGYNTAITSLLSQAGPDGRALTPAELLERAVEHVEGTYADDPAFLVQMLIMISGRYYDLQETNREYDTLVRAERAARRSGDASLLFRVHCNTVETELEAGRKDAARRRLNEAMALMPAVGDVAPNDHAACLRADAQLASADGDMPVAIARLREALRVLARAGKTEGNDYAGMLSMLAVYVGDWGDLLAQHRHLLDLVELDRRLGRADSRPGQIGRIALANSFLYLGDVREALTRYREILDGGTGNGPEKMFLGRALARLGHETALILLRESVAEMEDSGHERFRIRTRLALAEGLLWAGRHAEALTALDEALALVANDPLRHRFLGLEGDRLRALALLPSGRIEAARSLIADALDRDAALRHPGPERARLLLVDAHACLAGGMPAEAARLAAAAADLFERHSLDPRRNADLGEARLVEAEARLAANDRAGAARSLTRALPALGNGLGPGHALTRRAESLAASLPPPKASPSRATAAPPRTGAMSVSERRFR